MTTTNDIDAIRKLTDAATEGPWSMRDGWGPAQDGRMRFRRIANGQHDTVIDTPTFGDVAAVQADAEFIAAARTHVPALCDEIEQLRERLGLFDEVLLDAYCANDQVRSDKRAALGRAQRLADEIDQLRAKVADLTAERDAARDMANTVVEAAKAWRKNLLHTTSPESSALIAAVDALPKAEVVAR